MYIEGEVPYVGNNNGNNNGWNDFSWIIGLALVGGLFGGWGNGGFGFGGNRGSYGGVADNYVLATDFATIERKLDGVNNGLCDGFYAQNTNMLTGFANITQNLTQGFAGLNATINTGFAGVNNAICTLGYQNQAGFNALSRELADCCCTTQRNIDSLRYDMSRGFCDVVRAGQDNTRQILDYLTGEKISSLQAENAGLKAQISNDRQSAFIIDALGQKCPQPAYVVQPPQQVTFPTNCCGNVAYATNGCSGCNNF
jgi:hypothetical protein